MLLISEQESMFIVGGKKTRIKAHPGVATFQSEDFSVLDEKIRNDLETTEHIGSPLPIFNSSNFDQAEW